MMKALRRIPWSENMPNADDKPIPDDQSDQAFRRQKIPVAPLEGNDNAAMETSVEKPSLEPGQMAQLIVDARSGAMDREAASALAAPLTDLARAFALQAEVLKNVHENQREMAQAMRNDEKSSMMLNSTQALNDTFRGVKKVQQNLLRELQDGGRNNRRTQLLWAGCAVLAVVCAWWLFTTLQDGRDQDRQIVDQKFDDLKAGITDDYRQRLDDSEERRRLLEDRDLVNRTNIDNLKNQISTLSDKDLVSGEEFTALKSAALAAEERILKLTRDMKRVEQEKAFYLSKYNTATAEADRLRDEVLAKIKTPGAEWIQESTAGSQKPVTASINNSSNKSQPVSQPTIKPASPPEEFGPRKADPVRATLARMNDLMSRHRRSELYQLASLDSVENSHLKNVVLTETVVGKGVVRQIVAEELVFRVDARGDLVELDFRTGTVASRNNKGVLGAEVPFYKGRFRLTLEPANGKEWLGRREGFVVID